MTIGRARLLGAWALLATTGCHEPRREAQPARTEPGGGSAPAGAAPTVPSGDDRATTPMSRPNAAGRVVDPGTDDGPATEERGAIPVWQAVVDRDRYLARRGQQATISGRIGGEAIAPGARGVVRWLIDETEGNGALAVRLGIVGKAPEEATRVVATGGWALDDQRHWFWQVASLSVNDEPAPPPPPDPPAAPGHQVATAPPPSGYRPISAARDGGVVTFGVVRAPQGEGDGWLVADDSFGAPVAYLILPGERPSYGGHDLRQPDERWVLKRGVIYWVRIDRVRRRTPEDLARIKATTAPFKL